MSYISLDYHNSHYDILYDNLPQPLNKRLGDFHNILENITKSDPISPKLKNAVLNDIISRMSSRYNYCLFIAKTNHQKNVILFDNIYNFLIKEHNLFKMENSDIVHSDPYKLFMSDNKLNVNLENFDENQIINAIDAMFKISKDQNENAKNGSVIYKNIIIKQLNVISDNKTDNKPDNKIENPAILICWRDIGENIEVKKN